MSIEHTITLDRPIPRQLLADVEDKLPWCSEALVSSRIDPGRLTEVVVQIQEGADAAEVEAKVRRLIAQLIAGWREVPVKLRWDGRREGVPTPVDPWPALVASRQVIPLGPGQAALAGPALALFHHLDARFAALGRQLGAEDVRYPSMIPVATLDRCQYFSSFPHHVTFCSHLSPDVDTLAAFAHPRPPGEPPPLDQGMAPPAHALNPAVCFHAYATLADAPLASPRRFTTVGQCFRYEAGALTTLERLWDFTMREIIFVGPRDFVKAERERTIEAVTSLVDAWDLGAWIETANDPFFMTNFVAKKYHQLLTDAKFELRLPLPGEGRSVAAASFNYHENFFGRSYGITSEGELAHTACTAFGIERWVLAFTARHGVDPAGWPEDVRASTQAGAPADALDKSMI